MLLNEHEAHVGETLVANETNIGLIGAKTS